MTSMAGSRSCDRGEQSAYGNLLHHHIALADAARRYGRLWRQGIPYLTLMENGINHPNLAGHQILADSLLALFPGDCP